MPSVHNPFFLASERLGFRHWGMEDLTLALELWGNPEVTRLIGGPFSEAQVRQRLRTEVEMQEGAGVQYWPIFSLAAGELAGCCGLHPHQPEEDYEQGFHLLPAAWGRGMATEAARAVISYAAENLRAPALFAGHHPENHASRRVLEKLGFRYTHQELYAPTGLMHPCYRLELGKGAAGAPDDVRKSQPTP